MKGEKKIPEKTMEWFEEKTGGRTMVELNALEEEDFIPILEAELIQYSGLEQDKEDNKALKLEANKKKKEIIDKIDLSQFENEYNEIKELHDDLAEKINEFFDSIDSLPLLH